MKVQQLVPRAEEVDLEVVLARLCGPSAYEFVSFAPEILQFCSSFSRALFHDSEAKRFPELQALAFWMRSSALERHRQEFEKLKSESTWLVPRGLVFHIPPANVDTVFMYSWLLSVMAGNRNVLRISPRAALQTTVICRLFNACLEGASEAMRSNTVMIRYGHERDVTAAISALSDVRVIWGGDASVISLRSIPVPPHCKELTFPDRYSLSVMRASKYLEADVNVRLDLAARFYNDTYWFDQMACSSPRLLIWYGGRKDCCAASDAFLQELQDEIARRGYLTDTSGGMNKFTFLSRSILDEPVIAARRLDNQLIVAQVENIRQLRRDHCGGGFLFQHYSERFEDLAAHIVRKDQTLTYFGFDKSELMSFARLLNGRGVDRIVPIGNALTFQRYWDGYDLLAEMIRHVYIEDIPSRQTL